MRKLSKFLIALMLSALFAVPVFIVTENVLAQDWSSPSSQMTLPNRRLTDTERQTWIAEYNANGGFSAFELEVIRLINNIRQEHGLVQLQPCRILGMSTRFYSQTLDNLNLPLGHGEGPYGGSAGTIQAFGGGWNTANATTASSTPEAAVTSWMNSEGHRNNILNPASRAIGVGRYGRFVYMQTNWSVLEPSTQEPPTQEPPTQEPPTQEPPTQEPPTQQHLDAPADFRISGNVISWNAVVGADFYDIFVNGVFAALTGETSFDLSTLDFPYATHVVEIVPSNNSRTTSADWSIPLTWVFQQTQTPQPYTPNFDPVTGRIRHGNGYFQLFDAGLTWDEARAFAQSLGGDLAAIRNADAQRFMENLVAQGNRHAYWLGGYRQIDTTVPFRWVTGESIEFTNWYNPARPNYSSHNVLFMYTTRPTDFYAWGNGYWDTGINNFVFDWGFHDVRYLGFIVEWPASPDSVQLPPYVPDFTPATDRIRHGDHYFQLFNAGLTWDEARAYAQSLYHDGQRGDLVVIRNAAAQEFIQGLIAQGDRTMYWLGGYRIADTGLNQFAWVTGEPMTVTYWADGEPNNFQGIENRIMIRYYGEWNDLTNSPNDWYIRRMGFIVEWPSASEPPVEPPVEPPTEPPAEPPTEHPILGGHVPNIIYTNASPIGIFLEWSVRSNNVHGYRVFRASSATADGISISDFAFRINPAVSVTSIRTLDINVQPWTTYYYYVREVLEEARFDAETTTLIPEVLGPPSARVQVFMPYEPVWEEDEQQQYGFIMMFIGNPMMNVNDVWEEIDPGVGTAPVIIGGRTMVPIRAVVEAMGGTVGWDANDRRADLRTQDNHVVMWLGRFDVLVNGTRQHMDVVPEIVNDRTLIPVRFVAELLGAHIEWIASRQMVVIVYALPT